MRPIATFFPTSRVAQRKDPRREPHVSFRRTRGAKEHPRPGGKNIGRLVRSLLRKTAGVPMNYCIVVADGSRARLFTLEPPETPELQGGPDLTEHRDLVNPEKEQRHRELFTNLKSGRNQAPGNGPGHGYDDHRRAHIQEVERRFARRLAAEVATFAAERSADQIVLVADPRMLGFLRGELRATLKPGAQVVELMRDLSSLTPPRIHARLADVGLLPARTAP